MRKYRTCITIYSKLENKGVDIFQTGSVLACILTDANFIFSSASVALSLRERTHPHNSQTITTFIIQTPPAHQRVLLDLSRR